MELDPSILISCSLSTLGGNETHVLSLCRLLSGKNFRVMVASRSRDFPLYYRRELAEMGIKTISTPFSYSSSNLLKNLWAGLFWFRLPPFGLFTHVIAIGPGGFHRMLKRALRTNGMAMYWEAGDGLRGGSPAHLRMLHAMDKVAANSHRVAERIARDLGRPVDVLHPLNFLIETKPIFGRDSNKGELRISFLGRVDRWKGLEVLVGVWPELRIEEARLDVYGDGDEADCIKRLIEERGLCDSIRIHGRFGRNDLPKILACSDLVVLPSRTEGLPQVLLEAMAYGIPFVATNVGGVGDLAVNNPDVFVVEPGPEELAKGITQMAARIRHGFVSSERLKRHFQKNFSFLVCGQKWLKFLGID